MKRILLLLMLLLILPVHHSSANDNVDVVLLPKHENIRAIHFVLRSVSYDHAILVVDQANKAGFNTVIVVVTDGVNLKNSPWKRKPGAWSESEFSRWVEYVRGTGMQLVPELKLLTHQEKFFQKEHPSLMLNNKTYVPSEQVYSKVFPFIDYIIDIIEPQAIHIGHDEVKGWHKSWKNKLKHLFLPEGMLSGELFLEDVKIIHAYLKDKGVETWMWGDMLLSPEELPETNGKWTYYHGTAKGYGKVLRKKIPKSIVICDWHYGGGQLQFPSLALFENEGFRVLGATWKNEETTKNFSQYAASHGADGMIATTWFHVQRKEWDIVNQIIEVSGKTFLKDFP